MAIAFARLEFVQRSVGKNACAKAAYNSRGSIYFEGTKFQEAKTYSWSYKEPATYHAMLLPQHAEDKFNDIEYLWNAVERKENRQNSQVALEVVLALPDDEAISLEDKKTLTLTFIQKHFVDKGLIAQIDIHAPDKKITLSSESGELEQFNHNWHAHALITTRRLKVNGHDLLPKI